MNAKHDDWQKTQIAHFKLQNYILLLLILQQWFERFIFRSHMIAKFYLLSISVATIH